MTHLRSIFLILMTFYSNFSHADLFHKYQRGERGDVILEGYHYLVKEWNPLVLFFGFVDDLDDCEEVADLWNRMHSPYHIFRCTRIE